MRISDWSSDVCSSDLLPRQVAVRPALGDLARGIAAAEAEGQGDRHCNRAEHQAEREVDDVVGHAHRAQAHGDHQAEDRDPRDPGHAEALRSEEHTSELQSLMRISYAAFCLKKKTKKKRTASAA